MQLDYDERMGGSGWDVRNDAELEVQRTIKGAGLNSLSVSFSRDYRSHHGPC